MRPWVASSPSSPSFAPRFILFCLWLFSDYLNAAFSTGGGASSASSSCPPPRSPMRVTENEFTTLTGGVEAAGIVVIVLGVAIDLGLLGGSGRGIMRRD